MSGGAESPRLLLAPNGELGRVHLGLLSLSIDGVPLSRGLLARSPVPVDPMPPVTMLASAPNTVSPFLSSSFSPFDPLLGLSGPF